MSPPGGGSASPRDAGMPSGSHGHHAAQNVRMLPRDSKSVTEITRRTAILRSCLLRNVCPPRAPSRGGARDRQVFGNHHRGTWARRELRTIMSDTVEDLAALAELCRQDGAPLPLTPKRPRSELPPDTYVEPVSGLRVQHSRRGLTRENVMSLRCKHSRRGSCESFLTQQQSPPRHG